MPTRLPSMLLLFVAICCAVPTRAADEAPNYTHEDFVTSYWAGPPPAFTTFERYQEIKDANFTVAFPIYPSATPELNHKMLDFCQKLGMKAILYDGRMTTSLEGDAARMKALDEMVKDYAEHPALLGYSITDEPAADRFDGLAEVMAHLKRRDPKHPGYINLLPTWARQIPHPGGNPKLSYLGTATYEEYVRTFVQKVKPAWLCYDNYGMLKQGDRGDFFENLATVRKVAMEADIPFWNIVLATQHGDFRVLTEPELRFEAMQTLAFGARGLIWFTYWSPQGIDTGTTWTHAMINPDGSRDPHYDMIRLINADVLAMGRELKNTKSVAVTQHGDRAEITLGESPLEVKGGTLTLGHFQSANNKSLTLVANRDYKNPGVAQLRWPRETKVEQFDPTTRKWSVLTLHDQSADLSLPAGAGVLLRW